MSDTRFSAFQKAIDDKYLIEAAKGSSRRNYVLPGTLAACLCAALLGFAALKSGVLGAKSAAPAELSQESYEMAVAEEAAEGCLIQNSEVSFSQEEPLPAPDTYAECEAEDSAAEPAAAPEEELSGMEFFDEDFKLPEGASLMYSDADKSFDGCRLYEAAFTLEGEVYVLRMCATPGVELTDISGVTESFDNTAESMVSYCPSVLYWNEGEAGYICWYDVVPGVAYALYFNKNASEAALTQMAENVFLPLQG